MAINIDLIRGENRRNSYVKGKLHKVHITGREPVCFAEAMAHQEVSGVLIKAARVLRSPRGRRIIYQEVVGGFRERTEDVVSRRNRSAGIR